MIHINSSSKVTAMNTQIFTTLNSDEFKALLKEVIREVLAEQNTQGKNNNEPFSIKEAAAFLKVKITTLYEKTSKKLVPHFKKGNKLYFNKHELEDWIKSGKVNTQSDIGSLAATYVLKNKGRHH